MKRRDRAALGAAAVMLACAGPAGAGPALEFELPRLDGTAFMRLADHAGRPVLLNFWGSECPPCVRELPVLFTQAVQHPQVQFLGIAVDQRSAAARFLQRLTPTYPQLLAASQPEVLLRRFGNKTGALPYTVVLDAGHAWCASRLGEVDAAWVSAALQACARPVAR